MTKMIAAENCICQTMVLDLLCALKAVENALPGILIRKSITYLFLSEENERIKKIIITQMARKKQTGNSLKQVFQAGIALPENKVFMPSNIHSDFYPSILESSEATVNTHPRSSQLPAFNHSRCHFS